MSKLTAIFSSHYSLCSSVLTLEDTDKIKENEPVSIFGIAKTHNLQQVIVVDSEFSGYWEAYKSAQHQKVDLIFGVKMKVCGDMLSKNEESLKTESHVIVFFKNTQGYYDFIPTFSKASEGFYYTRRLDWNTLNAGWTDNLLLAIPFYSSFLAENTLKYGHVVVPDFQKMKPVFFLENHNLPIDGIITKAMKNYTKKMGYEVMNTHQILYYKNIHSSYLQMLKCIGNRTTMQKPNLNGFSSDEFSFESYEARTK